MSALIHTMPFLIRQESDRRMADACLKSLAHSDGGEHPVVAYNQGRMTNEEVQGFFQSKGLRAVILGDGENIGIPGARQACFEFIWQHHPDTQLISELHVDMVFPAKWVDTLSRFLDLHCDEPMIAPGILTESGELHPEARGLRVIAPPTDLDSLTQILEHMVADRVVTGFVHPVVHRADILKAVRGYDTRFLSGKQGFEDDSLLLGYRYYMGRRANWRPKAYLGTRVFHATLAQRLSLERVPEEMGKNLRGLVHQYGVYGLLELADIHQNHEFLRIAESLIASL